MKTELPSGVLMYPGEAVMRKLAVLLVVQSIPSDRGAPCAAPGVGRSSDPIAPAATSGSHRKRLSHLATPGGGEKQVSDCAGCHERQPPEALQPSGDAGAAAHHSGSVPVAHVHSF